MSAISSLNFLYGALAPAIAIVIYLGRDSTRSERRQNKDTEHSVYGLDHARLHVSP